MARNGPPDIMLAVKSGMAEAFFWKQVDLFVNRKLSTLGESDQQESFQSSKIDAGSGVDYIFDGTSISNQTVPNGLDENRIVTYKRRKKIKLNLE